MHTIDLMTGLRIEFEWDGTWLRFQQGLNVYHLKLEKLTVGETASLAISSWITERRAELEKKEKMMDDKAQWVQSKYSTEAKKWKVAAVCVRHYDSKNEQGEHIWLAKDEYQPCPPPTRWVDVTKDCHVDQAITCHDVGRLSLIHKSGCTSVDIFQENQARGYRLKKVKVKTEYEDNPTWAFIIEKKVSG